MENPVLVTGGAGYIGCHTCKLLAHNGYTPIVYDNLSRGHAGAVKWGPLEIGDLEDTERLAEVIGRYQPQSVIHFAAYAYVGESVTDPELYYRNNVVGTVSLLQAMLELKVLNMVFSSTCATYGNPSVIPITENVPQNPVNPYGRSKLMIEHILRDYCQVYDMSVCCLRYFNAAGADIDTEVGELHDPEPHVIPNLYRSATGEQREFVIYGDDYETADGTCIRDYIHVSDLAEAHRSALIYTEDQRGFHPFNLGSEKGYSVKEILATAQRVTGRSIPFRVGDRRDGDPPILVADASKALRDLSWTRRYTDLNIIMTSAWRWHLSNKYL